MHSFLKNPLFSEEAAVLEFSAVTVASLSELAAIIAKVKERGLVSIDTETTSTEPRRANIVGVSLAVEETEAFYVPLGHLTGENLPIDEALHLLKPMVESATIKKIGQNLKYDFQIFRNYDITMAGIEFDCMIAAYLIDPASGNTTSIAWPKSSSAAPPRPLKSSSAVDAGRETFPRSLSRRRRTILARMWCCLCD